jgi:hypothetical protein
MAPAPKRGGFKRRAAGAAAPRAVKAAKTTRPKKKAS